MRSGVFLSVLQLNLPPVTVFPAQVEEVGISYFLIHFISLLIGFKRSPICLVSS